MSDWIEEGQQAPAFTLIADDGTKVRLSEEKGSPVVLFQVDGHDEKVLAAIRER